MLDKIKEHLSRVEAFQARTGEELEQFRIKYLGKKGVLNDLFEDFKKAPAENKREIGQALNCLKTLAGERIAAIREQFDAAREQAAPGEDLSRPALNEPVGARHPISQVRRQVVDIFSRIGFTVADGPEIEDDWHNFTALNLPQHHPARDMQDTFFIQTNPDILLRTQTSSVQARHMETHRPPIRIISPGRVFRNEAISYRAHCMFHQIEGLYIDKNVSFADLKQALMYFTHEMFGKSKIRLRPSYFPFTEPSAEVDVYWGLESEADYRITKGTGWLEIMGCGMVDPNVLRNVGIDPDVYTGYAFGMGIERMAMLLYQVKDLRLYFENDVRFLEQFRGAL